MAYSSIFISQNQRKILLTRYKKIIGNEVYSLVLSLVACASDTKGVISLDAMKLEARG